MSMHTQPFSNADMLAAALRHLNATLHRDCPRSSAVSSFLLGCLARDEGYGHAFCDACAALSRTLRDWRTLGVEERTEIAPWLMCVAEEIPARN